MLKVNVGVKEHVATVLHGSGVCGSKL